MISYDGFGGKIWEFINFKGLITHAFVLSYFLACLYFCSVLFVIKHFLFQQLLSGCLPFPSNFFRSSSRKKEEKVIFYVTRNLRNHLGNRDEI